MPGTQDILITQGNRYHHTAGTNGSLERSGKKVANVCTIACRSLGKDGQDTAITKDLGRLFQHPLAGPGIATVNEKGSQAMRQASKERPGLHLLFGDKLTWPDRGKRKNIEIRDVVGRQHRRCHG